MSVTRASGRTLISALAIGVAIGVAGRGLAQSGGDCAASKRRAVGRCVSGNLACYAIAAKRQKAVDPLCLARVEAKLLLAFARVERGECLTPGDADAMRDGCAAFGGAMVAALPDAGPTPHPTATGTATVPPTLTATPVPPTATATATNLPTYSATPADTTTVTPTATATGTVTATPTDTPIATGTATQTPSRTETPMDTATAPADTETPTATDTSSPTVTPRPTLVGKAVFVTSRIVRADFGGLGPADDLCTALGRGIGSSGRFAAWLSDDVTSAAARLVHEGVPYQLVDATVVANDWDDLTDGTLAHAIDMTEGGEALRPDELVWTDTRTDGLANGSSCRSWSIVASEFDGGVGTVGATDFKWTDSGVFSCDATLRLYCIEQ